MNQKTTYRTIEQASEGNLKEKGSKFLSFAFPVSNEDMIRKELDGLRKKFFDARHHCYAWRLGPDGNHYRYSDDQEPSGTAGKPIYGQLLSFDVTDILVVVVRYFGGTLLGTGGLIQAYKGAAQDALQNAIIIEKKVKEKYSLKFAYPEMNEVMKTLKDANADIIKQKMELDCEIICEIPLQEKDSLIEKWSRINNLQVENNK